MWTVDVFPRWSNMVLTSVEVDTEDQASRRAQQISEEGLEYQDRDGDFHFIPAHAIDLVDFYPDE